MQSKDDVLNVAAFEYSLHKFSEINTAQNIIYGKPVCSVILYTGVTNF